MQTTSISKKYELGLEIFLLVLGGLILSLQINRTLVDYDEATYAKVVVDTLRSGTLTSFTLSGHPWFEKPPLYLWLAMGAVHIFGPKEFAFRLPGIIASLACLWLVYLITKKLTGNILASSAALLLLLFSPIFYFFSKEARLDSGVTLAILAALYFYLRGLDEEKFLFWILPSIALGFLFKSVIVLLIIPILFTYSICYGKWIWLRSKYLWYGLIFSLILLIPWHVEQTVRFGSSFWKDYFFRQVYQRSVSTITGTNNYYDYVVMLWTFSKYWLMTLVATVVLFAYLYISKRFGKLVSWREIAAPLCCALMIFVFFTSVRTHLGPYIFPAFPFLAMFVALLVYYLYISYSRFAGLIVILLLVLGIFHSFSPAFAAVQPYISEERDIGTKYKNAQILMPAQIYSMEWPVLETINYYGGTATYILSAKELVENGLQGPFYLITTAKNAKLLLYDKNGSRIQAYSFIKILHSGQELALLYSDRNLKLINVNITNQ
jgi:4-amino-4-deoxy-L-arabinose transferase-like glycosyltransferase